MRQIKYIVVHCTAGREHQTICDLKAEFIRKGWKNPGYHYVVQRDGKVVQLLSEDKVANGAVGINDVSIHIAYIGGVDKYLNPIDNRTDAQKQSLRLMLKKLKQQYPKAEIHGHRYFAQKACPSFDATAEYKDL